MASDTLAHAKTRNEIKLTLRNHPACSEGSNRCPVVTSPSRWHNLFPISTEQFLRSRPVGQDVPRPDES